VDGLEYLDAMLQSFAKVRYSQINFIIFLYSPLTQVVIIFVIKINRYLFAKIDVA
jgi:hypothetical protein